jgi:acetylornithine deacetylase
VRAQFERTFAAAVAADPWLRDHPPDLEWYGAQFGTAEIAADHPLVRTLHDASVTVIGTEPPVEGVAWGSDMRFFTDIGKKPAVLFGPGDVALAHYTDEFVLEDEIKRAMQIDALTILRWCGIAD